MTDITTTSAHVGHRAASMLLALLFTLALAPAMADAAKPMRGATYVGSVGGKEYLELPVSRDGRRIFDIFGAGPADCEAGSDGPVSLDVSPIDLRIGRGGRFRASYEADVGSTYIKLRGRFLSGGRVRGRASYFDRTCRGSAGFSARAVRRGRGLATPVFDASHGGSGFGVFPDGSFLAAGGGVGSEGAVRRVDLDGRDQTVLRQGPNLGVPSDVAILPGGGYLVAGDNCVRRVDAAGSVAVAAGRCDPDGDGGFAGDGGPATAAQLHGPTTVVATADGGFLFADGPQQEDPEDQESTRVRRVSAAGIITTVAGTGKAGCSRDGPRATAARLGHVADISVQPDGGFLIADPFCDRVRRVAPDGRITTVAGNGDAGFSGNGADATKRSLSSPSGVAVLPGGGFLIGDSGNGQIRRVSAGGAIVALAGGGEGGTGAPAGRARLEEIGHVRLLPGGGIAFLQGASYR